MTAQNNVPVTWTEIENQVRTAIMCQFDSLWQFGPADDDLPRAFLGIDLGGVDPDLRRGFENLSEAEQTNLLQRHAIYGIVRDAYDYAYQTDAWTKATFETFHLGSALLEGAYAMTDTDGEPSPLAKINDPPLRRMLETFVARWKLSNPKYHAGLTVRELALLSNMTVPAVRTSLSKEGFKLEASYRADTGKDENGVLPESDALVWLSRRRGFVPTRSDVPSPSSDQSLGAIIASWLSSLPFNHALTKILAATDKHPAQLADALIIDHKWLAELAAGRRVEIDINILRRLSRSLGAEEALFVGKAVQALIELEHQPESAAGTELS